MAGLLDAFNDPQFQRGLMMFAASMPMSEQQRAGLLSYMDNQEKAKLQREYMGLQMEGKRAEIDQKKLAAQKLADGQQFMAGLMQRGQPSADSMARLGMEGGAGFAGPISPQAQQTATQMSNPAPWTSQMSLDDVAMGKMYGLDLLPMYNAARQGVTFKPGEVTQLPDGRIVSIQKDGMINSMDGSVRFAPGAAEANARYQGMQADAVEGAKFPFARALERERANIAASNDVMQTYDPGTGRMVFNTRAQVRDAAASPLIGRAGNINSTGYSGGSREGANAESIAIMKNELMKPGLSTEDRQGILREIARLERQTPGAMNVGPMAAGPSASQASEQEANRVRMVEQAKADVTPSTEKLGRYDSAANAISLIDQALSHPGLKAATGLSGSIDPRNYIPGTDAKNFGVLMDQIQGGAFMQAFQSLKGGGQITEREGEKAQAAIARMNRAQSTDEFTRGLNEYREVLSIGMERARKSIGGGQTQAEASPGRPANQGPPPRAMKGMVVDGYKFKGGDPANPSNWERQ